MSSTDLDAAIAVVRAQLAVDPTLIERLAPGMMLVKRPMSPQERAKRAVPAMNAARREAHQRRREAAKAALARLLAANPAIMDEEAARTLNAFSTPGPYDRPWLLSDVVRLKKEIDLAH